MAVQRANNVWSLVACTFVVEVIVEENYEQFEEKIKQYNPLLIDEIAIDFEELFIIEVERRGYLNGKDN